MLHLINLVNCTTKGRVNLDSIMCISGLLKLLFRMDNSRNETTFVHTCITQ